VMPEITGVRHSTVDEDLAGADLVATWQGKVLTIDAKTGLYQPLVTHKHGVLHLEVSVPREAMDGLRLTDEGEIILHQEVRQALGENFGRRTLRHLHLRRRPRERY